MITIASSNKRIRAAKAFKNEKIKYNLSRTAGERASYSDKVTRQWLQMNKKRRQLDNRVHTVYFSFFGFQIYLKYFITAQKTEIFRQMISNYFSLTLFFLFSCQDKKIFCRNFGFCCSVHISDYLLFAHFITKQKIFIIF